MRYIDKKEEPIAFVKWKVNNQHEINQRYAKYKDKGNTEITKSEQVWSLLRNDNRENPEFSKSDLRSLLINEQGGICAYCGSLILNNNNTRLEHIHSKSDRIEGTFDYYNLVAVCSGGEYRVHTVLKGETVGQIAEQYATNVALIQRLNPYLDLNLDPNLILQENDQLELKIGTEKLEINVKVNFEHCDVKKKGDPISIKPTQSDCQTKFKYEFNGIVYGNDVKDVVEKLGLNDNPYIVEDRRVIREKVRNLANILIKSDPRRFKTIKNQKLEQLYANPIQYEKMAFVHEYAWNTYL